MPPEQTRPNLAFLLDVDNTLLDNDRVKHDLSQQLKQLLGEQRAERFWELYEEVRRDRDVVDFPRTIELLTDEYHEPGLREGLNHAIRSVPFATYLYPHVIETIAYLKGLGTVVILSDGDSVFQPWKIRSSGLEEAVDGHVLVYTHKELELADVFARYPAEHYVVVDDKPRILAALERECPTTFTTIFVLQGKYARPGETAPEPDYVLQQVSDLRNLTEADFLDCGHHSDARER